MTSCSSFFGGNACQSANTSVLAPRVADKVAMHPCYSRSGYHRFVRMHLPAASACNLQCNYCNRKFDCSNKPRPGVLSTLLTPEQVVLKVRQIAQAIPQLSMVGIAGSGNSLANITHTFRTPELVRDQPPGLRLCLLTSGLMLPDAIDRLLEAGADHVTVTINTPDADIARQIYAWLWFGGECCRGREAGEILIARQLEGVRRLTAAGVLVKIDSVLIPGINDSDMAEVDRRSWESGVFIYNIMPLIARPEYGTIFGLNGQPELDVGMFTAIRSQCGEVMLQMIHCHQCCADAIGMLGEDCSQQFTRLPDSDSLPDWLPILHQRAELHASLAMQGESDAGNACLVAVASRHSEVIDCYFGYVDRFSIYSLSVADMVLAGECFTSKYCRGEEKCEPQENEARLTALLALPADVKMVFCVRIGHTPWQQLELQGIEPQVDGAWRLVAEVLPARWQRRRQSLVVLRLRQGVV